MGVLIHKNGNSHMSDDSAASLPRGKDFNIMLNNGKGKVTNPGAFYALEQACIQMCKLSFESRQKQHVQRKTTSFLHGRFIYNMMVWGECF